MMAAVAMGALESSGQCGHGDASEKPGGQALTSGEHHAVPTSRDSESLARAKASVALGARRGDQRLLAALPPVPARADLSLFAGDTIFGTSIQLNGGVTVNGTVGVGPSGTVYNSGGGASVDGTIILNQTPGSPGTNATVGSQITENGSPKTTTEDLSGAIASIQAESNLAAGLATTQASVSSGGGNLTINATTSGVNVVDVTSLTSGGLTLENTNGYAGPIIFVLNFTAPSAATGINGPITLDNGILPSNVLFNIEGTGPLTLGGALNGTFLAPQASVTLSGATGLNGAILDGSTVSMDVNVASSGITIQGTGNLFNFQALPEPSTIALAVSGLVSIGFIQLVRRKRPE